MKTIGLFVVLMSLAGCGKETTPPPFEFNDSDMGSENNENNEPQPDVGISEEDMNEPVVRTIVERSLFGSLPLDNLVLDAMFRVDRSAFWWALSQGGFQNVISVRKVFPETPEGTPVLKTLAGASSFTLGQVNLVRGSMIASLWVGSDVGSDSASISVTVAGVQMQNPTSFQGVTLQPDPTTVVEIDGIEWVKHRGLIDDQIGYGYFLVESNGAADSYIHAPVVVTADTGNLQRVPASGRSLRVDELDAIRRFDARIRRDRELPRPTNQQRAMTPLR